MATCFCDCCLIVLVWLVAYHPKRLRKLAILNVPFPTILGDEVRRGNTEQMRKSLYIYSFQIPLLAERMFNKMNVGDDRNALLASSKVDSFSAEDLAVYERTRSGPGVVTVMLN